ncbi:hypothetical protein BU17DRAFT_94993 [Hysterangium stoloniferum]|nr:hypothetical protein BU17DRAFT_94993 [Hysterangium stoloniferum]
MFSLKFTVIVATLFAPVLAAPVSPLAPDAGAKPFTLKNGQDAIALNNKFNSLSASSACTDGALACINGQFAQCSGGKFLLTSCAIGTICVALPLVNKPGTVQHHMRHGCRPRRSDCCNWGNRPPAPAPATDPPPADNQVSSGDKKSSALSNGKSTQTLNKQFASLTTSSSCTAGQNACVNNQFAQCVDGKFVLTGCAGGLQCVALPLVNSPGTVSVNLLVCTSLDLHLISSHMLNLNGVHPHPDNSATSFP